MLQSKIVDPIVYQFLKICVYNIANARRDNEKSPLYSRLPNIIKYINIVNPDILVLLEAGRSSSDGETIHSWTSMAATIEQATGLTYEGVWRMDSSLMAFGKAVFIRYSSIGNGRNVAISNEIIQPQNEFYGSVLKLRIQHAEAVTNVGVVHFPMPLKKRMIHSEWVASHAAEYDVVVGDMNTFSDDGGAEMLKVMASAGFHEQLPADTKYTFKGFLHDQIVVSKKNMKYHPDSRVISVDDETGNVTVVPASWLDHVLSKAPLEASVITTYAASDHFPVTFLV